MKHLQIGDVFYVISGLAITEYKVKAITLQPDGEIVYNWIHRQSNVYTTKEDVINALDKKFDAMMNKINNELKGGE